MYYSDTYYSNSVHRICKTLYVTVWFCESWVVMGLQPNIIMGAEPFSAYSSVGSLNQTKRCAVARGLAVCNLLFMYVHIKGESAHIYLIFGEDKQVLYRPLTPVNRSLTLQKLIDSLKCLALPSSYNLYCWTPS